MRGPWLRYAKEQHILRVKPELRGIQIHERTDQQPRSGEDDDSERDLCDDQRAAQAEATASAQGGGLSAARLEGGREVHARAAKGGGEAENDSDQGCHG